MTAHPIGNTPPSGVILIRPSQGWRAVNLVEVWQYRELLLFLTYRDIKLRYKQTALGVSWVVAQPLLTMTVFTIFFGRKEVNSMEEDHGLDLEKFAEFFRYMYTNGVYVSPSQYEACFVSMAHDDENLIKTRDLILNFINTIR